MRTVLDWMFLAPAWQVLPAFFAIVGTAGFLIGRVLLARVKRPPAAPVDPEKAIRTRRRRKWAAVIAAVVTALTLTIHGVRVILAGREFEASQRDLEQRIGGWTVTRDPWLGPGLDGDSWPGYAQAAESVSDLADEDLDALFHAGDLEPREAAWTRARAVVAARQDLLHEVRAAARRRTVTVPVDVPRGHIGATEAVGKAGKGLRTIALLLFVSAKVNADAGNWDAAVRDVGLGLQVGCDLCRNSPILPFLVGRTISGIALQAAALLLQSGIPKSAAAELLAFLDRTGREMPGLDRAADVERLLVGASLRLIDQGRLQDMGSRESLGLRLSEWANGFSLNIAAREIDREWGNYAGEIRESLSRPWRDSHDLHMRWLARAKGGPRGRPLLKAFFIDLRDSEEISRLWLAHLSLMRAAAGEAAGLALPLPEDPFTHEPLHAETRHGSRVFWCEGVDGDQGGEGDWWGGTEGSRWPDVVLKVHG
ncbi:MAG: hypothetical protein IT452_07915 [Planctomycetia bacterium]|nr:hypothetical protein [Planctomycetia bacterium]